MMKEAEKVTTGYVIKQTRRYSNCSSQVVYVHEDFGRTQDWTVHARQAKQFVNHADAELTLGLIGTVSLTDDIKIVRRFAWK